MKHHIHSLLVTYFPRFWFFLKYRTENEYQNYVYSRNEIVPYGQSLKKLYALSPVLRRIMAGRTFLELGCDKGFFPLQAAVLGAKEAVGVDRNTKALDKARKAKKVIGLPQVRFIEATIPNIPLKDKYDTVMFMSAIHYMFSDECGNRLLFHTMDSFIGYLDQFVSEYLVIEFVDIKDHAAEMLVAKSVVQAGEYSHEAFLKSLHNHFEEIVDLGHTHYETRTLYLACK